MKQLSTIDFIPAGEWQVSPHDADNIRKATEARTASFEQMAQMVGSGIYTCRYNEIGTTCSDTSSLKDGRPIITEQNLIYVPVWIRFCYEQIPSTTVYQQLQKRVLPHLKSHQNDLTKLDYEKIVVNNNSAPFVYCYCDSGTDLLHLMPTFDETDPKIWLGKDHWRLIASREMLDYHKTHIADIVRQHKNFLHFDGNEFHTCSREQIREIYLNHIEKICHYWVTRTQIFLVKSSCSNEIR